jgi:hypothetical protein
MEGIVTAAKQWFSPAGSDEAQEDQGAASSAGVASQGKSQHSDSSSQCDWADHWSSEDRAWQYVTEAKADPTKPVTFFRYLEIAKDGGLSDITGTKGEDDLLWSWTRYISAFMAILFVFGNTAYVVYVDMSILFGNKSLYGVDDWLLSKFLVKQANAGLNVVQKWFGDSESDDFFDNPAKLIASVELLILLALWGRVAKAMFKMFAGSSMEHCGPIFASWHRLRWYAAQHLFFNLLPTISVYSSLLMLFPAAPKVFMQDLFKHLFYRHSNTYYLDLLWLIVTRVLCFIIGFDSFLVKFREGANQFIVSTPESDKRQFQLANFIGAFMLLNQILGVVQLNWMIKERLFRFVFAGEDGIMTQGELVKKNTWNAQIAETLYTSYSMYVDKLAMLLTFSDDDFQRLTLHERQSRKEVDADVRV